MTVTVVLRRKNLSEVFGDETYKDKNIIESNEKEKEKEKEKEQQPEESNENGAEKTEAEQQANKVKFSFRNKNTCNIIP